MLHFSWEMIDASIHVGIRLPDRPLRVRPAPSSDPNRLQHNVILSVPSLRGCCGAGQMLRSLTPRRALEIQDFRTATNRVDSRLADQIECMEPAMRECSTSARGRLKI